MKNSGFTLAELCITLVIIGVVAVIAAPSISALMPDANKTKIVNLYNKISEANAELVNNPDYFLEVDATGEQYTDENGEIVNLGDGVVDCIGLACNTPTVKGCETNKYACLLAKALGGEQTLEKIELPGITMGVKSKLENGNIQYHCIQVKLLNAGEGCVFDTENCKKPNIFRIKVENDGSILPADAMLEAYLKHPDQLKNRKEYREEAKKNLGKEYYWDFN